MTAMVLVLVVASLFATVAQGHMIMANPVPYGYETIDNSPLTGSNYPCKVTSDPATFYSTDGIDNTYPAGSSQSLSFKGSAVHGGGSCQLAITNDMQPSASTDWRVILSIESGCPTTDGSGPSTYNWTVPAELAPGQYSFAWTWISKLAGQPEYYMNCAPITVTAATASSRMARRDAASYPELFVANLDAINSCKTEPSTDPVYPDPGPDVEKLLVGATANFATITQSGCVPLSQTQANAALPVATAGGGAGSDSGSGGSANTTAAVATSSSLSSVASSAFATSSSSSQSFSIPGGSFATATQAPSPSPTTFATSTAASSSTTTSSSSETLAVIPVTPTFPGSMLASASSAAAQSSSPAASEPATTALSSTVEPSSTAEASTTSTGSSSTLSSTSAAAPTATGSGSSSNSTGGSSGSVKTGTCSQEGIFNCVDAKYQQCASGSWTSMQALPGGTTCTQGLSEGLWARGSRLARRVPRGRMATLW